MWLCSLEGVEASHSTSHPTCYWIRDDDRSREEYGNLSSAMSPLCLSICGGYLSPDSSGDTEMEKGDFNEQSVRSRSFSSRKQSACWPPSVTFSMDFVFFFYVKCLCMCHYLWPTNYKAVVWRFTAAASRGGTLTHSPSLTVQCNGGNYTQTCTHRPWDNHTLKQILTPGH